MLWRRLPTTSYRYRTMSSLAPSSERVHQLSENFEAIRNQVVKASASSGKTPTLVLVSKLKPPSDIMAIHGKLKDSEKHFGENYVQEVRFLKEQYPIS